MSQRAELQLAMVIAMKTGRKIAKAMRAESGLETVSSNPRTHRARKETTRAPMSKGR